MWLITLVIKEILKDNSASSLCFWFQNVKNEHLVNFDRVVGLTKQCKALMANFDEIKVAPHFLLIKVILRYLITQNSYLQNLINSLNWYGNARFVSKPCTILAALKPIGKSAEKYRLCHWNKSKAQCTVVGGGDKTPSAILLDWHSTEGNAM